MHRHAPTLVTSTPAKMAAVSEMPGRRSASSSGGRWFRCRYTWSFSGPHPRPSRISIVMLRDTTSRDARSFAVGAYLAQRRTTRQQGLCNDPAQFSARHPQTNSNTGHCAVADMQEARALSTHVWCNMKT